jgi:hypothetical protein
MGRKKGHLGIFSGKNWLGPGLEFVARREMSASGVRTISPVFRTTYAISMIRKKFLDRKRVLSLLQSFFTGLDLFFFLLVGEVILAVYHELIYPKLPGFL